MQNWGTGNGGGQFGMRTWGAEDECARRCVSVAALALTRARRCGSVGAFCVRRAFGVAVLLGRFALGSRLLFAAWRQTGRLVICFVSILPGRDRHCAFSRCRCGYLTLLVHFGIVRLFVAISTGLRGDEKRGVRGGWRRGRCTLLRGRIGFVGLSAGSTLGLRAPDCAKESSTLWTLFTLRRGCVGTYSRPLCVFAQPHWPCESFRGEYAGAKCGSSTAAAPRLCQRVECGSGTAASLDSLHADAGLGWCGFAAVTRVHGKTCPALIYGRSGRAVLRCYQLAQTSRLEPPSSGAESGCVREAVWRPHCGWPGGSGCIAMLPTRSNVQTRAALKRRGVGLCARSGVEAALRLAGQVGLYCDVTNSHNRRPA